MVGIHIVKNPKRQAGKMNGISETGNEDGATGFCAHCRGKSYVEKADEDRFADCIRDNLHNVVEDLIKVFANEKKNMKEDYIKVCIYSVHFHRTFGKQTNNFFS